MSARLTKALALTAAISLTVAIALGVSIAGTGRAHSSVSRALGPEGVPLEHGRPLGPPRALQPGEDVDGVICAAGEALTYHVHAHLSIVVHGAQRAVPLGIGIGGPVRVASTRAGRVAVGGGCFSFLHTHAADGIVHVEAPLERDFTLGQFFDVWGQPLARDHVGLATGRVTAFVDGQRYRGDLRSIRLRPHAQIQLDVGRPVAPPAHAAFPTGL